MQPSNYFCQIQLMFCTCQIMTVCTCSKYDALLGQKVLFTQSVEFRRQTNANAENCKYSQQQTIYLVETFFHSNLLQSSLTSLSIVRSPPNTLHKAETRIYALNLLGLHERLLPWVKGWQSVSRGTRNLAKEGKEKQRARKLKDEKKQNEWLKENQVM